MHRPRRSDQEDAGFAASMLACIMTDRTGFRSDRTITDSESRAHMPRIRYQVASSLDGFIAGPNGEFDWIIMDPAIDFEALAAQFDTLVMGRKTYEAMLLMGGDFFGKQVIVFSRSLKSSDHPDVTIVQGDPRPHLEPLRAGNGKDVWLFGGGELFRSLLEIGLVDTVEPAIIPILLGGGIPFLPSPAERRSLSLTRHHVYPSGIVLLEYAVTRSSSS